MPIKSCSSCGKSLTDPIKSCVCGDVCYCDGICQKVDWKRHKPSCPPYAVKDIPGKGKGLVATRKLITDTVILAEEPLIVVGADKKMEDVLADFNKLSLETKNFVLNLFDKTESGSSCSLEEKVVRIFETNYLMMNTGLESERRYGMYRDLCRINHSCAPNSVWSWNKNNMSQMEVRTCRPIAKGEEIVASYVPYISFMTRTERKRELDNWNFVCFCEICVLEPEAQKKNDQIRAMLKTNTDVATALSKNGDYRKALES